MSDGVFDAEVAATYDANHGGTDPALVTRCVDRLVDLANGGAALEFAIGTGRIALPFVARGVPVSGNELSAAMLAQMRKKPGGADLPVVVGDMTQVRVDGDFSLVYLVYNTIDNLTTQDAQVACFENASRHLRPGGCFVVETLVPPLQRLPFGKHTCLLPMTPIIGVSMRSMWSRNPTARITFGSKTGRPNIFRRRSATLGQLSWTLWRGSRT